MQVGIRQFREHISEYLQRSMAGEDVVITRHGLPLVRLVSAQNSSAVAEAFAEGRLRGSSVAPSGLPEQVHSESSDSPTMAQIVVEGRR